MKKLIQNIIYSSTTTILQQLFNFKFFREHREQKNDTRSPNCKSDCNSNKDSRK